MSTSILRDFIEERIESLKLKETIEKFPLELIFCIKANMGFHLQKIKEIYM